MVFVGAYGVLRNMVSVEVPDHGERRGKPGKRNALGTLDHLGSGVGCASSPSQEDLKDDHARHHTEPPHTFSFLGLSAVMGYQLVAVSQAVLYHAKIHIHA